MRWVFQTSFLLLGSLTFSSALWGWSFEGHRLITSAALERLMAAEIPWTEASRQGVVEASVQPDLMRPREMPGLRRIEAPRHYINLEILQGRQLPSEKFEYINLLVRLGQPGRGPKAAQWDFGEAGMVPYAVVESTQRLAAVFAQLRRRPDDVNLQSLTAHHAGLVAHYAQDMCQPLHTSIHHDGRSRPDGSSPGTGIHFAVDDLLPRAKLVESDEKEWNREVLDPIFPAVLLALEESYALVDTVYEFEGDLEILYKRRQASRRIRSFAQERYERAVRLTTDLIFTAWHLSGSLDLPSWFEGSASKGTIRPK